jgi:histidinol phosphatase-like PHP family hydrolase
MPFKYKAEAEKILSIKENILKKETIKFQESTITDHSPRTNASQIEFQKIFFEVQFCFY